MLAKSPRKSTLSAYKFSGTTLTGKREDGVLKASTHAEAEFKLQRDGLNNLTIKLKKPWWEIEFGKTVSPEILLQVTRQMASFAQAGISAAKGLSILATTTENKVMRKILEELLADIEGGSTLSESVSRYPHVFPSYYPSILSAAERSGDLPEAFLTLNLYLERDLRSRRAIRSAMTYPIVLILLTLVAITVLSVIVLPKFEIFFNSLEVELPLTTSILLSSTRFVGNWWWLMALGLAASTIALLAMYRNTKGRVLIDRAVLHIPIFGNLVRLIALERFCRVLSTLVKTQVPLPDALELAGRSTSNRVYEAAIAKARERVMNGEGLAEPLAESNIFPSAAIQILRVGEESGRLESQLVQAASYYADELDHRMRTFTSLIEPITLLIMGGGIGFVAVALVSAMYGIYGGVK